MSDRHSFTSFLQKRMSKFKERVFENFTKVERTTDMEFEKRFSEYSAHVCKILKYQKELKNYEQYLQSLHLSKTSLMKFVKKLHSPPAKISETMLGTEEIMNTYHKILMSALKRKVVEPLNSHIKVLGKIDEKIRARKKLLQNYDYLRHQLQEAIKSSPQNKWDVSIAKMEDDVAQAKMSYEDVNYDLLKELPPALSETTTLLFHNLSEYLTSEASVYADVSKHNKRVFLELGKAVKKISEGSDEKGSGTRLKELAEAQVETEGTVDESCSNEGHGNDVISESPVLVEFPTEGDSQFTDVGCAGDSKTTVEMVEDTNASVIIEEIIDIPACNMQNPTSQDPSAEMLTEASLRSGVPAQELEDILAEKSCSISEASEKVKGKAKEKKQVIAIYSYNAENDDELSFQVNDIINVIPFSKPCEQEDGWLLGNNIRLDTYGLFPGNFTKPI